MGDLSNVLWVGGPAGAGKTTVARLLARRHGLRWYNSDAHTWEHRDRALAAGVVLPERGPGQRFYDRRPMIVDDLRALPATPLVVAEGGLLTPAMVEANGGRAVWLLPSRKVQRVRLEGRHPDGVPAAYLRAWDEAASILECSPDTIAVDGLSVEETLKEVERHFAAELAAGPTAATLEERRAMLRYANQAIVTQCLSPSTKPLKPVEPEQIVRDFECECARPDCTALVTMRAVDARAAAELAGPPAILAPAHA